MRAVLLILILAIVAGIVAVGSGLVNVKQTRGAQAPGLDASRNGVSAQGGQPPAFDIETGSVSVGTRDAQVKLPTVDVQPAGDAPPANQSEKAGAP